MRTEILHRIQGRASTSPWGKLEAFFTAFATTWRRGNITGRDTHIATPSPPEMLFVARNWAPDLMTSSSFSFLSLPPSLSRFNPPVRYATDEMEELASELHEWFNAVYKPSPGAASSPVISRAIQNGGASGWDIYIMNESAVDDTPFI